MPFSLALLAESLIPRCKNIILFSSGGGPKSPCWESTGKARGLHLGLSGTSFPKFQGGSNFRPGVVSPQSPLTLNDPTP